MPAREQPQRLGLRISLDITDPPRGLKVDSADHAYSPVRFQTHEGCSAFSHIASGSSSDFFRGERNSLIR
ncbi:hypothetical protein FRC09_019508, partial [Ceratobasidium sp. 395]